MYVIIVFQAYLGREEIMLSRRKWGRDSLMSCRVPPSNLIFEIYHMTHSVAYIRLSPILHPFLGIR